MTKGHTGYRYHTSTAPPDPLVLVWLWGVVLWPAVWFGGGVGSYCSVSLHGEAELHLSQQTSYESGDDTKPAAGQARQFREDTEKDGDFTLCFSCKDPNLFQELFVWVKTLKRLSLATLKIERHNRISDELKAVDAEVLEQLEKRVSSKEGVAVLWFFSKWQP